MSQYLRPVSDVDNGSWQDQGNGSVNLWAAIDEVSPSDSDFAQEAFGTPVSPYELHLSAGADPGVHTGHKIRLRARANPAGGTTLAVTLIDTSGPTTVKNEVLTGMISGSWVLYEITLTSGEAAAIARYDSLDVALQGVYTQVSWLEFEIPAAGFDNHLDASGPGKIEQPAGSGHYLIASGPGYLRIAGTEGTNALFSSGPGVLEHV